MNPWQGNQAVAELLAHRAGWGGAGRGRHVPSLMFIFIAKGFIIPGVIFDTSAQLMQLDKTANTHTHKHRISPDGNRGGASSAMD